MIESNQAFAATASLTDTSASACPPSIADGSVDDGGRVGQRADAERHLATEPRLDVRAERLLAVRRPADEAVEDLVDLRLDRGLVREARELREEAADRGALVAGEVHPDLAVHDRIGRHVAQDGRVRRPAGEQADGQGADSDHQHADDAGRDQPALPVAVGHDRGGLHLGAQHVRCRRCRRRSRVRIGRGARRIRRLDRGLLEIVGHRGTPCSRLIAGPSVPRARRACRLRTAASSASASHRIASRGD